MEPFHPNFSTTLKSDFLIIFPANCFAPLPDFFDYDKLSIFQGLGDVATQHSTFVGLILGENSKSISELELLLLLVSIVGKIRPHNRVKSFAYFQEICFSDFRV